MKRGKKMINLKSKIVKELNEGKHTATLEGYEVKEQQRIDTETGEIIKLEFLELTIKADNEPNTQPLRIYENGLNWLAQGLQSQFDELKKLDELGAILHEVKSKNLKFAFWVRNNTVNGRTYKNYYFRDYTQNI